MRKVLLSVFLLPSLAMLLWVAPAYPQFPPPCAAVINECYISPSSTPKVCESSPGQGLAVGNTPGAPCARSPYKTAWVCSSADKTQVCCQCRLPHRGLRQIIVPEPGQKISVVISSAVGLNSVSVVSSENVRIEIPEFELGTFLPIYVTVTKIDPLKPASFNLQACDSVQCLVFDPIDTLVVRETGKPVQQRFTNLPFAESNVQLVNHTPGVKHLEIRVNGKRFQVVDLKPGERREFSISSAMVPGDQNEVTLTGLGKPGGSVTVLIHD